MKVYSNKKAKKTKTNIISYFLLSNFMAAVLLLFSGTQAEAAAGDLDPTFGIGGKASNWLEKDQTGNAVAIQPDGKIIVAGFTWYQIPSNWTGDVFFLARYNADGSLDPGFGSSGIVKDSLFGTSKITAVSVLADGKIIAAGYGFITGGCNNYMGIVARYNPDGSIDYTFGNTNYGKTFFYYGCSQHNFYEDMSIQPDGKIVVAGYYQYSQTPWQYSNYDFAVVRLNTDGSSDLSFNGSGGTTFPYGFYQTDDYFQAVAVHPTSSKIILAGHTFENSTKNNFVLIQLNPDGSFDQSFGWYGRTNVDFFGNEDYAYALTLQTDGKIIVGGSAQSQDGTDRQFALARFNPNGSLDTAFGSGGKVTTNFGSDNDYIRGVAVQTDGKIVAGGTYTAPRNSRQGGNFAVARYNPDGSLDTSFNTDGKQTTDFFSYYDYSRALAIQPDGKILLAGSAYNGTDYDIALARYLP